MQRYFPSEKLEENVKLVDEEIIHHIKNVMHNKVGDKICLVNKSACIYEIKSIGETDVCLLFVKEEARKRENSIVIDFAIPLLKKSNFEMSMSKATELGVNGVYGLMTNNSVVRLDSKKWEKKEERYNTIIEAAAKQAQRNIIPNLLGLVELKKIKFEEYDLVITAYENKLETNLLDISSQINTSNKILLIVGPEGGLTDNEVQFLKDKGSEIITLGNTILRAETAVLTMMSQINLIVGDK